MRSKESTAQQSYRMPPERTSVSEVLPNTDSEPSFQNTFSQIPIPTRPTDILGLQRTLGNRATEAWLRGHSSAVRSTSASTSVVQRMVYLIGQDAATARTETGPHYGTRFRDPSDAAKLVKTDQTLHIVAHHYSNGTIGGMNAQQLVDHIRLVLKVLGAERNVKAIHLHACYSDPFAQQMKQIINGIPGGQFVTVYGTIGLSVTDLKNQLRVANPQIYGNAPLQAYQKYQADIKNGNITPNQFEQRIEPTLLPVGQGYTTH